MMKMGINVNGLLRALEKFANQEGGLSQNELVTIFKEASAGVPEEVLVNLADLVLCGQANIGVVALS